MAEKKEAKKPAEENKKGSGEKGKESGKKKLHLHQIVTTRAKDGTFGHEHIYKDHPDDMHSKPPVFAGTSQDMEDLHQHMDDHFGGGEEQEEHTEPDQDDGVAREHSGEPEEPGEE